MNILNLLQNSNNPLIKDFVKILTAPRKSKNITRLCGVILGIVAFIMGGLMYEMRFGMSMTTYIAFGIIFLLTLLFTYLDARNIKND